MICTQLPSNLSIFVDSYDVLVAKKNPKTTH